MKAERERWGEGTYLCVYMYVYSIWMVVNACKQITYGSMMMRYIQNMDLQTFSF